MPQDKRRLLELLFARLYGGPVELPPEPPPFPPAGTANAYGCVTVGSRLSTEAVLTAYREGIFPMAEADGVIGWWSPEPRTVIGLDDFHVSRRLARTVRQGRFELRVDTDWEGVVAGCADRDDTWISEEFMQVYGDLFRQGHVHTVEAWHQGELAGGLYGVTAGGAFMAESMFHRVRDAAKVAVVGLVERLRAQGFVLLDIQYETKATAIFRPQAIPRAEYLRRLKHALTLERSFL